MITGRRAIRGVPAMFMEEALGLVGYKVESIKPFPSTLWRLVESIHGDDFAVYLVLLRHHYIVLDGLCMVADSGAMYSRMPKPYPGRDDPYALCRPKMVWRLTHPNVTAKYLQEAA